jgi:hypothetical protein
MKALYVIASLGSMTVFLAALSVFSYNLGVSTNAVLPGIGNPMISLSAASSVAAVLGIALTGSQVAAGRGHAKKRPRRHSRKRKN